MSDLIERAYAMYVSGPTIPSCQLCKELADEIERLECSLKISQEKHRLCIARFEALEGVLYPIGKLGYDQTPRQLGMSVKALHRIRALAAVQEGET